MMKVIQTLHLSSSALSVLCTLDNARQVQQLNFGPLKNNKYITKESRIQRNIEHASQYGRLSLTTKTLYANETQDSEKALVFPSF
jgi:hypothetical protein